MRREHRIIAILLAGLVAMAAVVAYTRFVDNADITGKKVAIEKEDLGPANLGQLRYFTSQAAKYLDWKLKDIGGAGPAITQVLDNLKADQTGDTAPITVEQLEEAAQPYYDRLNAVGYNTTVDIQKRVGGDVAWTSPYPWNPVKADAAGNTTAQVGQLKFVFGFDLIRFKIADDLSTNREGLPDKWIVAHGLDPFDPNTASEDPDKDDLNNMEEYQSNSDPHNPDSDGDGVSDGMDGVPFDARFKFERQPVPQYATIDLGPGESVDANEDYEVLIRRTTTIGNVTTIAYKVWSQGTIIDVPSLDENGNGYQWSRIGKDRVLSGMMVSEGGKVARPARWKPGDTAPTVLTADKVLVEMSDLNLLQPHGEIPLGSDHIYFGLEGIFYETAYYQEIGGVRYEEAMLLLWDNGSKLRVVGDALGSGPTDAPKSEPKQSILLASAMDTNLVYEMTGNNVLENDKTWRTTTITSRLLLNGKMVPGSDKTMDKLDLAADLSLGNLARLSDAQNLTHPVVPDFFGNHTLYMDPGGSASLVAVDWPAGPEGKGVVRFKSLNAAGIGVTPDGKEWVNGVIHGMSGLLTEEDSKKFSMHANGTVDGGAGVIGSIHFYSDDKAAPTAKATSRVTSAPQASAKEFEGVIPLTSAVPRCAPTYPAATQSVITEKPGDGSKGSKHGR